jgi:hypothetical protein
MPRDCTLCRCCCRNIIGYLKVQDGKLVLRSVDFVNEGRQKIVVQCRSLSFNPNKFSVKVVKTAVHYKRFPNKRMASKATLSSCHLAGIC